MLYNIILVVHVLIAATLIGFVLIQQGKGADAGAAFGGGASGTVFGSQGSASFLTRTTGILATLFFVTSLTLFTMANNLAKPESIVDQAMQQPAGAATDALDIPQTIPAPKPESDIPVSE